METVSGARARGRVFGLSCAAVLGAAGLALAQEAAPNAGEAAAISPRAVRVQIPEEPRWAREHATGRWVWTEWASVWKPVCGTAPGLVDEADLLRMAATHDNELAPGMPVRIVDSPRRGGGINIVYVLGASVPAAAVPAFQAAEAYLEGLFNDPITVTVTCSFANLGPGVLGGTGSTYGYVTYAGSRLGLVNGMDGNDTIQAYLPGGSTVPVRYNGNNGSVTNENRVFWTLANYNAAVGSAAGAAASMQYSSTFSWDFDPSNGVGGSSYSFQDVIIHETGHALGFTSGADFRVNDLEALDLFRFQSTDGAGDYNPDTLAEFQTRARLVDYNVPNDAHNSDLIGVEYRMSDGSPYQASHFREQTPAIGLMDPALGFAQTFYPGFFTTADLTMFDAIGYDR